jgi:hypothetical protein
MFGKFTFGFATQIKKQVKITLDVNREQEKRSESEQKNTQQDLNNVLNLAERK